MIGRLNHVGIATPDIDATLAMYRDLYGATVSRAKFALPEQGVSVAFIDLANSQLELIEPLGEASPVWSFLKKFPAGGQHHICFEVPDIIAARDAMRAKGATVLGTGEPRIEEVKASAALKGDGARRKFDACAIRVVLLKYCDGQFSRASHKPGIRIRPHFLLCCAADTIAGGAEGV